MPNYKEHASLLQISEARLQRRESFQRILYVASLVDDLPYSLEELRIYHRKIVEQLKALQNKEITGLLIILKNTVIHLLEGPSDTLTSLFRHFTGDPRHSLIFKQIKILSSSEDCSERYMTKWIDFLHESEAGSKVSLQASTIVDDASAMYENIVEAGKLLCKAEFTQLSTKDQRKVLSCLPTNELLLAFDSTNSAIPTLQDFLSIYDTPIDVTFEEDSIWPIQELIDLNI